MTSLCSSLLSPVQTEVFLARTWIKIGLIFIKWKSEFDTYTYSLTLDHPNFCEMSTVSSEKYWDYYRNITIERFHPLIRCPRYPNVLAQQWCCIQLPRLSDHQCARIGQKQLVDYSWRVKIVSIVLKWWSDLLTFIVILNQWIQLMSDRSRQKQGPSVL